MTVAIYERDVNQPGHAWKFARVSNLESAQLAKEANEGFGVETLLIPAKNQAEWPQFLDAYQK